ncbi:MAG: TRAP transporter large permease [Betaproteobacteria bacterium]
MISLLFSAFFIFILIGVPIAFAIGLASFAPLLLDGQMPFALVISKMFGGMDSFPLMAIPFFVLTGTLAGACNLIERITALANFLVGGMRAGLAQVNIVAAMLFGGITGSAVAESAALGSILIPSMVKRGYPAGYAAGITACAATIGALIPPSVLMIIYGFLTGVSTGKLFLAGAIPGVLVGIALMIVSFFVARRKGFGKNEEAVPRTMAGFVAVMRESGPALLIPVVILGGIVGGVFTPTEAGVVAVVTVLVLGQFVYGGFSLARLKDAFLSAVLTTSMVMLILSASTVFANLLTRARFQSQLIALLSHITTVPDLQLGLIVGFILFLGCFIDATAILIMFAAPLFAVGTQLGYDPVHFAVTIVVACLIGGVTPPVGTLMFIAAGIARIGLGEASRGIWPFVLALIFVNMLVALIPGISTWIPGLVFGP